MSSRNVFYYHLLNSIFLRLKCIFLRGAHYINQLFIIPFFLCRKNNNFRKDNQKKQRAKPSSGKRQETIKINEKKNYTSWSSSSSAMAHKNASWIFSRAKNRDESRKETVKSDWLFDRASSRKRFHDLNKAEWYNRKVYGKHCDESGDCETIDYVSLFLFSFFFCYCYKDDAH